MKMQIRSRELLTGAAILFAIVLIGWILQMQNPADGLGGERIRQGGGDRSPASVDPSSRAQDPARTEFESSKRRSHLLQAVGGAEVGQVSVLSVREDGASVASQVQVPGALELPAEGDWLTVVQGDSICPQLVMLQESEEEGGRGNEVWVVPSGSANVAIQSPSGRPWAGDELIKATIRTHTCPEGFPEGAVGLVLGSSQRSRLTTASLKDLHDYFASGFGNGKQEELTALLLQGVRDERLALLSSTSLRSTLEVAEFNFEVRGGLGYARHGLPAGVASSWRIYREGAFDVLPKADGGQVDPSGDGFVRNIGRGFRPVWSADFVIPEQGVIELAAVIYEESGIAGVLDLAALPGSTVESRVAVFSRFEQRDANGKLLVTYDAECVVYPDEQGAFSAKGLLPGSKRIAAIWKDESGTVCVASRIFELPVEEMVDLGLIQPTQSQPVRLQFELADAATGRAMRWDRVFGEPDPGELTVILKNRARSPQPEDDFWEALYPELGTELTILGLSPSDWHVTVMAGGAETDWPMPVGGLSVDRRMQEFVLDTRRPVEREVRFDVSEPTEMQLQVAFPPGVEFEDVGRSMNLNALVFQRMNGERQKMTLHFEQSLGGFVSRFPAELAPAFVVLGGLPGSEDPMLGSFELTEEHAQSGRTVQVRMGRGYWAEATIPSAWVERLATGVLMLDVDSWPTTARAHLIGILDADNRVRVGPVPEGALLTERTLGLIGVVRDGKWVLNQD